MVKSLLSITDSSVTLLTMAVFTYISSKVSPPYNRKFA